MPPKRARRGARDEVERNARRADAMVHVLGQQMEMVGSVLTLLTLLSQMLRDSCDANARAARGRRRRRDDTSCERSDSRPPPRGPPGPPDDPDDDKGGKKVKKDGGKRPPAST